LNRDQDVNIFLGDATGHGVAAAFMTMMIQIGLDAEPGNLPPDQVLRDLNHLLATREHGDKSVTGVFIRVTAKGLMTMAHAAHPPTIIIPADGSEVVLFCLNRN